MSDDSGAGFILAAFIDVLIGKSAQKHRWVRALRYVGAVLFLFVIALALFVTVRYS